MLVVKLCMWPRGDRSKERTLAIGTLACIGQATRSEGDVVEGERAYRVRLYKDRQFKGPTEQAVADRPLAGIWRQGIVRGHLPGRRGAWDLLGGALQVLLGNRLERYTNTPDLLPEDLPPPLS